MATNEIISILIKADGKAAVRELEKVGAASRRSLSPDGPQKFTDKLKASGPAIAGYGAALAGAAAVAYDLGLKAADLEQAVGATETVFGSATGTISEFADTSAEKFGLSERAARQLTAQLGAMITNLGYTQQEAASTSVELAKLGADLSAAFGGSPEEAVQALSAALRGERDPIERYGVSLKDADVQQRLAQKGMKGLTGEAKKHATAVATLELIYEQTANVQGQFARESDTASGSLAIFNAELEDLQAQLGEDVLPLLKDFASLAGDVARGIKNVSDLGGDGAVGEALAPFLELGYNVKVLSQFADGLFGTGDAANKFTPAIVAATKAALDNAKGTEEAGKAAEFTAGELENLQAATERLNEAEQRRFDDNTKRREELLGIASSQRDVTKAQIDAVRAQEDLIDAQIAYDEALRESGPGSREARDAQRELQDAFIRVQETADDAKLAAIQYGEEVGNAVTGDPAKAINDQIKALEGVRDTLAPGSPLRKYLDEYIRSLKEDIPKEISTELIINARIDQTGRFNGARDTRAIGGPVSTGTDYLVGERGPEIFRPSTPGVIVPNNQLRSNAGGGDTINITVNAGAGTDSVELEQAVIRALANARRRGIAA